MRLRFTTIAAALVAFGAAWLAGPPSFALSTDPFTVADLVRQADQIVTGTVTKITEGTDERGLPYTQVELKVAESIRGNARGTMTFRQFGLQTPRAAANGRKFIGVVAGMPRYTKDQQVLLFLSRTSTIGFRTTLGLTQGRFEFRGGNVHNGNNNAGLFRGVNLASRTLSAKEKFLAATDQGSLNADTFVALVKRAVNESWFAQPTVDPTKRPVKPTRKLDRAIAITQ
jgi:hypothetical protein